MTENELQGYFFAVVGPSGAGKDSLMDGAKTVLPKDQYVFAKRVVTRPPGQVGEDYESCTESEFAARKHNNEFLMTWQAHGFEYGLTKSLAREQAAGHHVIANCSRQSLKDLQKAVSQLVVLSIWASPETLAKRLHKRGRETAQEIALRLKREAGQTPPGLKVVMVDNNGTLAEGQKNFLEAIAQVVSQQTKTN